MKKLSYPENQREIELLISKRLFSLKSEYSEVVEKIVKDVSETGDQALYKYTEKYDGVKLENLRVNQGEIEEAYRLVEEDFIVSLKKAIKNVRDYHRRQLRQSWFNYGNGGMTGQLINPLNRIGAYVPGGRAPYPSSVVMTVVPARVAGVKEVVITTPPESNGQINPFILVAAAETGVDEIYKLGGAQAVAALASGTESVKQVDKIVGPGNIFVTLAKKMVYGMVDIDMLAGPSEVLILADETARPDFLAADLLSQAEHDPRAVAILISTDQELIEGVEEELEKQLVGLKKEDIARRALQDNGLFITVNSLQDGLKLVNRFAPEHFEMIIREPFKHLSRVKNAGAIFIGEYSSEPLGDYLAGPNHVLPTAGTARYASPLNTDDFLKKSSIIYYNKEELKDIKDDIIKLAALEGLDAHARAIEYRFRDEE